jgi:transposase InsO family protein
VSPARRRRAVEHLQAVFGVSQRWACQLVGQHRSTQRHQPVEPDRDRALRDALRQFSRAHPRWGYRRAHAQLRAGGWAVNRKAIQRLWREEGLRVPTTRRKRRRLGTSTCPADRLAAEHPDHVWALDYQFDQTTDGRILKLLNVVDEHTREALTITVERRIDADACRAPEFSYAACSYSLISPPRMRRRRTLPRGELAAPSTDVGRGSGGR